MTAYIPNFLNKVFHFFFGVQEPNACTYYKQDVSAFLYFVVGSHSLVGRAGDQRSRGLGSIPDTGHE